MARHHAHILALDDQQPNRIHLAALRYLRYRLRRLLALTQQQNLNHDQPRTTRPAQAVPR